MKYIKSINEKIHIPKKIDNDFIKKNPDFEEEHADWIQDFNAKLGRITDAVSDEVDMILTGNNGVDDKKGPYAEIEIEGDEYTIWTTTNDKLWIENFTVDNTSDKGYKEGFEGDENEIIDIIIQEYAK